MLSSCGSRTPGLQGAQAQQLWLPGSGVLRLSSCGSWAPGCSGSAAVAPGLRGAQAQQLWLPGSGVLTLSSCGSRAPGCSLPAAVAPGLHGAHAQQLWLPALVVPRHVGSSWTRDQTWVSCMSRRILYPRASREVLCFISLNDIVFKM